MLHSLSKMLLLSTTLFKAVLYKPWMPLLDKTAEVENLFPSGSALQKNVFKFYIYKTSLCRFPTSLE